MDTSSVPVSARRLIRLQRDAGRRLTPAELKKVEDYRERERERIMLMRCRRRRSTSTATPKPDQVDRAERARAEEVKTLPPSPPSASVLTTPHTSTHIPTSTHRPTHSPNRTYYDDASDDFSDNDNDNDNDEEEDERPIVLPPIRKRLGKLMEISADRKKLTLELQPTSAAADWGLVYARTPRDWYGGGNSVNGVNSGTYTGYYQEQRNNAFPWFLLPPISR